MPRLCSLCDLGLEIVAAKGPERRNPDESQIKSPISSNEGLNGYQLWSGAKAATAAMPTSRDTEARCGIDSTIL